MLRGPNAQVDDLTDLYLPVKVIPIYGRGGVQEDPIVKHRTSARVQHQGDHELVPRRPAGRRLVPTNVKSIVWHCVCQVICMHLCISCHVMAPVTGEQLSALVC